MAKATGRGKGGGKTKTKPKTEPKQPSKAPEQEESTDVLDPPSTRDYYIRCEGGDKYITLEKAKKVRKKTSEGVEYEYESVPAKVILVSYSFEDYIDEFKSTERIVYYGNKLPKKYTLTDKELAIVRRELIKRNKRFEIFSIDMVEKFIPVEAK